jgi:hypothetical protein
MTTDVVIAGGGPNGLLIRPDGYVAWAADSGAPRPADGLRRALQTWFGAAVPC